MASGKTSEVILNFRLNVTNVTRVIVQISLPMKSAITAGRIERTAKGIKAEDAFKIKKSGINIRANSLTLV